MPPGEPPPKRVRVRLVLVDAGDPVYARGDPRNRPPAYRLKGVLKDTLRQYGFRCVECCEVKPEEPTDATVPPAG